MGTPRLMGYPFGFTVLMVSNDTVAKYETFLAPVLWLHSNLFRRSPIFFVLVLVFPETFGFCHMGGVAVASGTSIPSKKIMCVKLYSLLKLTRFYMSTTNSKPIFDRPRRSCVTSEDVAVLDHPPAVPLLFLLSWNYVVVDVPCPPLSRRCTQEQPGVVQNFHRVRWSGLCRVLSLVMY